MQTRVKVSGDNMPRSLLLDKYACKLSFTEMKLRIKQKIKGDSMIRKALSNELLKRLALVGLGIVIQAIGGVLEIELLYVVGALLIIIGIFQSVKYMWNHDVE